MSESRPTRRCAACLANASSIGSDTMNNMMALWLEAFRKYYPNVKIQIEGKGSEYCAAGPDRRHGSVRADVAADEVERGGQIRAGFRLQANALAGGR